MHTHFPFSDSKFSKHEYLNDMRITISRNLQYMRKFVMRIEEHFLDFQFSIFNFRKTFQVVHFSPDKPVTRSFFKTCETITLFMQASA